MARVRDAMAASSSARGPTLAVEPFALVLRAMNDLGLPTDALLRGTGTSTASLAAGVRPSVDDELRVWDAAVALSRNPAIGLRVADRLKPSTLGALGYLLQNSATLEALLARAQRYARLVDDLALVRWEVSQGVASIELARLGHYAAHPAGTECLFAVAIGSVREVLADQRPVGVRFAHPRPADLAPYVQRFGTDLRFGEEHNRILVDEALLHVQAPRRDDALARILEQHTELLLAQRPAPQGFADEARLALQKLVLSGHTESAALARALAVSDRTMRRRLALEGTSFAALLDDARKSVVLGHAGYGRNSWEHIAELAGFGDMSAFYRAFRRWTGTTPAKYRRDVTAREH
jgi:AraC-like DNA-binding protein